MQEVWKSFNLKSDGAGFFERFLSQNDSKWGFSSIFKNWLVEFFDFLCEVTATESLENDLWFFWVQNQCMELFWVYWMNLQWYKGLKLAQRIFFCFFFDGEPCTEVCGQKEVEREFFELHNKSVHWVFLTFCMKLQQHKIGKLGKIILTELLGDSG